MNEALQRVAMESLSRRQNNPEADMANEQEAAWNKMQEQEAASAGESIWDKLAKLIVKINPSAVMEAMKRMLDRIGENKGENIQEGVSNAIERSRE